MATVAPVRLRVVFDGRRLLTKSQRFDGLRRCWFLLRSELSTVSDLAAHLADAFALRRSCPDGLLLFMDGFVLPPFESTDVFRDKDVVWVKRKVVKSKRLLALPAGLSCLQESPITENGPVLSNLTVDRIRDSQTDTSDKRKITEDKCEDEEDESDRQAPPKKVTSLKRKREKSDKRSKTKKKKERPTDPEKNITTTEETTHFEQNKKCSHKMSSSSKLGTEKPSDDVEPGILPASPLDVEYKANATLIDERHDNRANCFGTSCGPHSTSSNKKIPSRSACRKKARRQWRREEANRKIRSEVPSNNAKDISSGKQTVDQIMDEEEELAPIIVRPGHIRFESVDEEGSKLQSNGTFVCSSGDSGGHETLQWNGTTNKKKGQKWGREKNLSKTDEDDVPDGTLMIEEGKLENSQINFESLYSLTRLPQEGDVVVYRLLELSSSWCPEISPFRVGKVYSYDPISMKIILVPVLEYPIFTDEKKDEEESERQPDTTLYNDDGSLEIDYSSLIDVRLLKDFDSKNVVMNNNTKEKNMETALPSNLELTTVISRPKHPVLAPSESSMMGWEQIDLALKEKKAQLEKKQSCGDQTPSKSTRSYKGLRGNGLGHTLAFLRRTCDNQSDCSA